MILDLPNIPIFNKYDDNFTVEQHAMMKCTKKEQLSILEEKALQELINFYKEIIPKFKEIDLSIITKEQVTELKKYLDSTFSFILTVSNYVKFELLYRVSFVRDEFLKKGKVRNPVYLKYPSLKIVKRKGVYNRANTNERTVFYASFKKNVAIIESKPAVGARIIITVWKNITGEPFNSYPITNSTIENEGVRKATKVFKETKKANNPLFAEIMDLVLGFLSSEFVKECEIKSSKQFEYLYSAYFADKILTPNNIDDLTPNIDFIIYPSVAWKHQYENVAIIPDTVNNKLKLIKAHEYEVEETYYGNSLQKNEMPVKIKCIREADWIEDNLIIWDDE